MCLVSFLFLYFFNSCVLECLSYAPSFPLSSLACRVSFAPGIPCTIVREGGGGKQWPTQHRVTDELPKKKMTNPIKDILALIQPTSWLMGRGRKGGKEEKRKEKRKEGSKCGEKAHHEQRPADAHRGAAKAPRSNQEEVGCAQELGHTSHARE